MKTALTIAVTFGCLAFAPAGQAQPKAAKTKAAKTKAAKTKPSPPSSPPSRTTQAKEEPGSNKAKSATRASSPAPGSPRPPDASAAATPPPGAVATAAGAGERTLATTLAAYEDALNAFKYQDFDTAIPLFRKALSRPGHLTRKQRWRGREFLGASLWFNGDKQSASDQFTGLLIKNPQALLDPAYYPPQMSKDFSRVRRKMIALGMIKDDDKPTPLPKSDKYRPPPAVLSWIPFGVGQMANDDVAKGIAFMVAESALAATSMYYYTQNVRTGAKAVPHSDAAQAGQIVPAIGFYVVAAWGMIDAVFNRRKIDLPQAGTLPTAR